MKNQLHYWDNYVDEFGAYIANEKEDTLVVSIIQFGKSALSVGSTWLSTKLFTTVMFLKFISLQIGCRQMLIRMHLSFLFHRCQYKLLLLHLMPFLLMTYGLHLMIVKIL